MGKTKSNRKQASSVRKNQKRPHRSLPSKAKAVVTGKKNSNDSATKTDVSDDDDEKSALELARRLKKKKSNRITYLQTLLKKKGVTIPPIDIQELKLKQLSVLNGEEPEPVDMAAATEQYYKSQIAIKDRYIKQMMDHVDARMGEEEEFRAGFMAEIEKKGARELEENDKKWARELEKKDLEIAYLKNDFIPGGLKAPVVMRTPNSLILDDKDFVGPEQQSVKDNLLRVLHQYPVYNHLEIYRPIPGSRVYAINFGSNNTEYNEYCRAMTSHYYAEMAKARPLSSAHGTMWNLQEFPRKCMPKGLLSVICAVIGADLEDTPDSVYQYSAGHLSTKKTFHQVLHQDGVHTGIWSLQHSLSPEGMSVQFLNREEFLATTIDKKKTCQSTKVHAPENHMLLWRIDELHCGSFGNETYRNERQHISVALSEEALVQLGSEYNHIYPISKMDGFDRNRVYNCDGKLFQYP